MKLEIELAEADQKWERRLIAALGGHADSKLWGDDGLIAATWRCVEGYEKMEKELAEARMTIDDVCRVIAKEHEGPRLAAMRIVDELAEARDQLEGAGKLMGACDALLRQLAETKAEADKWEKLYDQDTEHLASLQMRDNYGPTETLNETAMRLSRELAEARKQRDTLADAANKYTIEHAKRGAVTTETIEQLEKALAASKTP